MKIIRPTILIVVLFTLNISCEKKKDPSLDDFCAIKPEGWQCEVLTSDFNKNDIPKDTKDPIAIVKYYSAKVLSISSIDPEDTPASFILNLHSIKEKDELLEFINSQRMYSWCIPIAYGQTKDYFIITSPCFSQITPFTIDTDSSVQVLEKALGEIVDIQ